MIYNNCTVYGPYTRKEDKYSHVVIVWPDLTKTTVSYARYLLEVKLQRYLTENEDAHHKDENPENNSEDNLEVRERSGHRADHTRKYYDGFEVQCVWCDKKFTLTALQQRTRKENLHKKAGPFCSRSCSGKYGKQFQG